MLLDREFLLRFVAESGGISSDVRAWVIGVLLNSASKSDIRKERDRLLRAGAALVPGKQLWSRSRRIHEILKRLSIRIPAASPELVTPRDFFTAALLIDPRVLSTKSISRIISVPK